MASTAAMAKRRALAFDRFSAVFNRLNDHFELEAVEQKSFSKDPELRRVEEMEWLADLLERLADKAGVAETESESADDTVEEANEPAPDESLPDVLTKSKKPRRKKKV